MIRGIVTNIDKTIQGIEKAVTEAENQSGINIRVVNVGIAGQHIKSSIQHGSITRDSTENEITVEDVNRLSNDMYKIVIPPGSEIIHVMPQDYIVDYEEGIKDPVEVLRGASGGWSYGTGASGGVILIHTKKGQGATVGAPMNCQITA